MRYLTSIVVNLALVFTFAQAQSSHVHAHESTARHTAAFLHTHLPHIEVAVSEHPQWRDFDPEQDAQFVSWLLTSPTQLRPLPVALITNQIVAPLPGIGEWWTLTLRPNAHDPPDLNATPLRAPPK